LWVTLVVNSLIEGLEGGDDMKDLQRRLSELPAGLEPLYQRMFENIQPRYHEQAAQLFRIVDIAASPLTPLALSFIDEDPKAALSVNHEVFSNDEIKRRHILVAKRLKSRCAGLIEISVSKGELRGPGFGEILSINWMYQRVQFLHLTVKEFLVSDKMQNWLATRPSTNILNIHVGILTCGIRQLQVTACAQFHRYDQETKKREIYFDANLLFSSFLYGGIIRLIFFHALQIEILHRKSQLIYLEALDKLLQDSVESTFPRVLEREKSTEEERPPHWTTFRYLDWFEQAQWQSDYAAYLVTIGMTRAVIDKIHADYNPSLKPGRPLLHYAITTLAPEYAIDHRNERDTVDPEIVEELLKQGCDPNQSLNRLRDGVMSSAPGKTTWQGALIHIWRRFCLRPGTDINQPARHYYKKLSEQADAMNDLRLKWVKSFKLLVEYGADLKVRVVVPEDEDEDAINFFKMSALSIFMDAFAGFEHPLVETTRELLISKGVTELKQRVSYEDMETSSSVKRGTGSRLACCCNPS
jgi:hypothetical protein